MYYPGVMKLFISLWVVVALALTAELPAQERAHRADYSGVISFVAAATT
jgi:hypothetical protein